MAAKVALTAEEFRENSQRSIALFNTEKLSTNSTHVLKSAYAFCAFLPLQSARSVWRQRVCQRQARLFRLRCNLHGACGGKGGCPHACQQQKGLVAICTERVEAKRDDGRFNRARHRCNLHGAYGGKAFWCWLSVFVDLLQYARDVWKVLQYPSTKNPRKFMQTYCIFIHFGV